MMRVVTCFLNFGTLYVAGIGEIVDFLFSTQTDHVSGW